MARETVALALLLLSAHAAHAEDLALGKWSHRAPLAVPEGGKGLASFAVPPVLFDLAAPTLSDLRLVYDDGIEAPFIVSRGSVTRDETRLDAALYNRVHVPGASSTVTADFGKKARKNRVEIDTAGTSFWRKVRIEGSDDGAQWAVVRDGALVYRFSGDAVERSAVGIPANDMRYLRVTVYHGPDDPATIEIARVGACLCEMRPPKTEPVSAALSGTVEKDKGTEITLDLGYRNLPLYEIALAFADASFHRHVSVAGRNEETRTVEVAREGGGAVARTVEVPWSGISRGVVFRAGGPGGAAPEDESLAIDIMGAQYRYLRVRIENRDDRPLVFTGAAVTRRAVTVELAPRPGGGALWIYAGNHAASAPQYDLGHYIARLRAEGVVAATAGAFVVNPLSGPAKPAPWSERHRWILWAALLCAAAVMGLLIWRQARGASPA